MDHNWSASPLEKLKNTKETETLPFCSAVLWSFLRTTGGRLFFEFIVKLVDAGYISLSADQRRGDPHPHRIHEHQVVSSINHPGHIEHTKSLRCKPQTSCPPGASRCKQPVHTPYEVACVVISDTQDIHLPINSGLSCLFTIYSCTVLLVTKPLRVLFESRWLKEWQQLPKGLVHPPLK